MITYWFTVRREHGRFPLDMLRYDRCYPDGDEDVTLIANSLDGGHIDPCEIKLIAYGYPPTKERWLSYGWRVVETQGI